MKTEWPRLSQDLHQPARPDCCQHCGTCADPAELVRWQEYDRNDRPELIAVVLCEACSEVLIEKHPRLYGRIPTHAPWPGCMPVCVECRFREGLRCKHPDLKGNGGKGLVLVYTRPLVMHVDGTRKGRRAGWIHTEYRGPVSCRGGEASAPSAVDASQTTGAQ